MSSKNDKMKRTTKRCKSAVDSGGALIANRKAVTRSLTAVSGWVTSEVRRQRCVCSGIVRSMKIRNLAYPMILDIMHDGIFSVATFPTPVCQSAYGEVCQLLNRMNYHARYGKFVLNDETGEVKFRVFRSSDDMRCHSQDSMTLLTALPAQMLDDLAEDISKFVERRSSPARLKLDNNNGVAAKRGKKR